MDILVTIFLFYFCVFGLSIAIMEFFPWGKYEAFVCGIGCSLYAIFLFAWALYALGLNWHWMWGLSILSGISLVIHFRILKALFNDRLFLLSFGAYAIVSLYWLLCISFCNIAHGGGWAGDWFEHYSRSHFFFSRLPKDTLFLNFYLLPARPPMANVLCAGFWEFTGASFAKFQILSTLMNSMMVWPLYLLAFYFAKSRNSHLVILVVLGLALNPMIMQNMVFLWTKLFASFYVLLSLWCYLRRDSLKWGEICSFAFLAIGFLVHYSAGPYIVVLVLMFLINGMKRWKATSFWREIFVYGAIAFLLMLPWFGWSIFAYGWGGTFATNTTVSYSAEISFYENVIKTLSNIVNTIVPHPLRSISTDVQAIVFSNIPFIYWRDYFFNIYQTSALFAAGSFIMVAMLLHYRKEYIPAVQTLAFLKSFWLWWALGVFFCGIAVVGPYDEIGLAHICLQPLISVGLIRAYILLFEYKAWIRVSFCVFAVIDFFLGIVQHLSLLSCSTFADLQQSIFGEVIFPLGAGGVGPAIENNYRVKVFYGIEFWGDAIGWNPFYFWLLIGIIILGMFGVSIWLKRKDM